MDGLNIPPRINRTELMGHIFIHEAADRVRNGIDIPDVIQKLISQPFPLACPLNKSGNVEKFESGGNYLFRMD